MRHANDDLNKPEHKLPRSWYAGFIAFAVALLVSLFIAQEANSDEEPEILFLVVTFFEKPVLLMNANPYMTIDNCETVNRKLVQYPPELEPHMYCERMKPSEAPNLQAVTFSAKEQKVIDKVGDMLGIERDGS